MNAIRDKLNNELDRDEKMLALAKSICLFGNPEGAPWEMRAHVAYHAFEMLAGALETREEARLPKTLAINNMFKVREWTTSNELKKPVANALGRKKGNGTPEEQTLGNFLDHWKHRYKFTNKEGCDFIMRNVPWYAEFCNVYKHEQSNDTSKKANEMLLKGYAMPREPEFEGKKELQRKEFKQVYQQVFNVITGSLSKAPLDKILKGVDPIRKKWYEEEWAKNRPKYIQKQKEFNEKGKQRSHERGVKPNKRKAEEMDKDEEQDEDYKEEEDDKED